MFEQKSLDKIDGDYFNIIIVKQDRIELSGYIKTVIQGSNIYQ